MRVNLYKIKQSKISDFITDLSNNSSSMSTERENNFKRSRSKVQFFVYNEPLTKSPDWIWLARKFSFSNINISSNPKAILVIKYKRNCYAYTFGTAYFIAEKYCDSEFSFNFARKIEYTNIQLVSKIAPHSRNNKTIDSFISNESLFFDSGEAFTKIKGKVKLERDFNIFKENIEIGLSIKFTLFENTIENLINIIIYVSKLESKTDKTKIPLLKIVPSKETQLLTKLKNNLTEAIKKKNVNISIANFDIRGTTEFFYSEAQSYLIKNGHKSIHTSDLNISDIVSFIESNSICDEKILATKIISKVGNEDIINNLIELIDYVDDTEQCVLINGKWYKFNNDYQTYLQNSLNEIEIIYEQELDYSKSSRITFIKNKFEEEKDMLQYVDQSSEFIRNSLERKYYRERYYNIHLSEKDSKYMNYDRDLDEISGLGKVELADIYYNELNNETIYAVKIGKGSASLSYVVSQSEAALEVYKSNLVEKLQNTLPIKNVGIWIILDRVTKLSINENGKPNINDLEMFILKNRIDEWKKKVRLLGLNPIIRINYVTE